MRWTIVHAFPWIQRVLTAFDEDMACVAPVGFACFASMQFSLWKYQVGSLWLPCMLVTETPSQLTHQEEHEKVTVRLSKEGQIKSLWSGGCWGPRGLQRPPHHPAVPRHEPVSPGHTGSSCSVTWGVDAQMSALISSDALGFSGCTGLLSPAQKITLYWLWSLAVSRLSGTNQGCSHGDKNTSKMPTKWPSLESPKGWELLPQMKAKLSSYHSLPNPTNQLHIN